MAYHDVFEHTLIVCGPWEPLHASLLTHQFSTWPGSVLSVALGLLELYDGLVHVPSALAGVGGARDLNQRNDAGDESECANGHDQSAKADHDAATVHVVLPPSRRTARPLSPAITTQCLIPKTPDAVPAGGLSSELCVRCQTKSPRCLCSRRSIWELARPPNSRSRARACGGLPTGSTP